jgi:hypothetical protein
MREYASSRTNIHLAEGDTPAVSVQLNNVKGGNLYAVVDIECLGHNQHIFVYASEGETSDALLGRIVRGLSPVVKAESNA